MKKRVDSFQDIFFAYMPIELVDKLYACLEGKGFPCGSVGKESTCSVGDLGSIPGLGRSPGRGRAWQPTLVFLPEEAHGLQSMGSQRVGHS